MMHTDPHRRHDFVLLFEVTDGNPNGDPDANNMPRTDPETLQGLVTDVAIKRKVRDYVAAVGADESDPERRARLNIYVEHRGILNAQHRKAYTALKLQTTQPGSVPVTDTALLASLSATGLPDGFSLHSAGDEEAALVYSGELTADDLKEALAILAELSPAARKLADAAVKRAKTAKATRDQVEQARAWMTTHFYDVRMFGAVMSTGVNAGQVRGPLQLTFARSIDPVLPRDISITRVAITREEDQDRKQTEMGRKTLVHYGLYVARGFYSPHLATGTGVSADDLSLFWEALANMWALDRSASRGHMAPRGLYVFTHERKLGDAPAHQLFERINVQRRDGVPSPRAFSDYSLSVRDDDLPAGVHLTRLLEG